MTIDPNAFLPTAIAGKAAIITDPGNPFFAGVGVALGAITPIGVVGPTIQNASSLVHFDLLFPTGAATQTFTVTTPDKIEIVDVIVRKDTAGAGNTVQVKDATATNPISDAIAAATANAITRAGSVFVAFNTIAAGAKFTVVNTFAAGDIQANVTVVARRH